MKNPLKISRWSPYAVGAGIGILSWLTFGWMDQALGVSTTFVRAAGLIEAIIAPDYVAANAYFRKTMIDRPAVDWQMMLVVGLFLGALISARLGGSRQAPHVPGLWQWRVGPGAVPRYLAAFVGGVLVLFGARLAGGCTSGHGISGTLQLAVGSIFFVIAFFAAGVGAAFLIFGKEGRNHV